jgi:hypothetical protein
LQVTALTSAPTAAAALDDLLLPLLLPLQTQRQLLPA